MSQSDFEALSLAERMAVQERILNEIKGRMLEDIWQSFLQAI